MAAELRRYNIDIATITETRFEEEGSLTERGQDYTFFWKGVPAGRRKVHGVGFAIRNKIANTLKELPIGHSERIISLRLPLTRGQHLTLICAYAPTLVAEEQEKDAFYSQLHEIVGRIDKKDKVILSGDLNARVGCENLLWEGVLGAHGVGNMNSNGLRLLSFCSEFQLAITNTYFQLSNKYKNTWKHPRSGHWHMLDHVMIRRRDLTDCLITRVMRGAECGTDHLMQRSILRLKIRPTIRKRSKTSKKLNTALLNDQQKRQDFQRRIQDLLTLQPSGAGLGVVSTLDSWRSFSEALYSVSAEFLGTKKKSHKDWFDENDHEIREILANKNRRHNNYMSNPSTSNAAAWRSARADTQRQIRELKDRWWLERAKEIQEHADCGRMKEFYDAIKAVSGPTANPLVPLRAEDGATLLKDKESILNRWASYFSSLLNNPYPIDEAALNELPQLPIAHEMDALPTLAEVEAATAGLKNGKAAGPDGIPPEVFKYGGGDLNELLLCYFVECWDKGEVPTQWKLANIMTIYKRKGEKCDCSNYRGLSLLDVAGKIFARVLLARFNKFIASKVLPESQCGFRADRSTSDMIFVCRQLLEKSREQQMPISIAFIDLQKAFDTVNREMLLGVLKKFGCPPVSVSLLRALHTGTKATVVTGSEKSEPFAVTVGVKQGCVLAPALFNVYLVAVSILAAESERRAQIGGVSLRYRFDGGLFNLPRTRVSNIKIRDLQYADDAAIACSDGEELQSELNAQNVAYDRMGLRINARKTEVMHRTSEAATPIPVLLGGEELKVVEDFTYLGSVISSNCSADKEITSRIGKASAAFGQLRERVYLNRSLHLTTKVAVYNAIVLAILLYGSETWTLYSRQLKELHKFHMRCLRQMLFITWRDKITNNAVLERSGSLSIDTIIATKTLRWAGHLGRMDEGRLPKITLFGELAGGTRPVGRPKKRYKDQLKGVMKSCNIDPNQFENLTDDRSEWRRVVGAGVGALEQKLRAERDRRRNTRHQRAATATSGNIACPDCPRRFHSTSGYLSHRRAHERRREGRRLRIEGLP